MATNETTEVFDVMLTEEDMLAFFLSKSGEVSNSELVKHFKSALKKGQHRASNRRLFPRLVNRLATVRVEPDGSKTLLLKKEFMREDAAAAASEDNNNDVVSTTSEATASAADAQPADIAFDRQENEQTVETASQSTDRPIETTEGHEVHKERGGTTPEDNNHDVVNTASEATASAADAQPADIAFDRQENEQTVETASQSTDRPIETTEGHEINKDRGGTSPEDHDNDVHVPKTATEATADTRPAGDELGPQKNDQTQETSMDGHEVTGKYGAEITSEDSNSDVLETAITEASAAAATAQATDVLHPRKNDQKEETPPEIEAISGSKTLFELAGKDEAATLSDNDNSEAFVATTEDASAQATEPALDLQKNDQVEEPSCQSTDMEVTESSQGDVVVAEQAVHGEQEHSADDSNGPPELVAVCNDDAAVKTSADREQPTPKDDISSILFQTASNVIVLIQPSNEENASQSTNSEVTESSQDAEQATNRGQQKQSADNIIGSSVEIDNVAVETSADDEIQTQKNDKPSASIDGRSIGKTQPSNTETAIDFDVGEGLPDVLSTLRRRKRKKAALSEATAVQFTPSGDQPTSTVLPADGDLSDQPRVRQLAQRIDEAASKEATSAGVGAKKQVRGEIGGRPRDRASVSSSTPYDFTMNDTQREWTLYASSSDHDELARLLNWSPSLASRRDFITGYSALHWAAKNGSTDVVKLLLDSPKPPDVDARTHGGYTALHVAAMNKHHRVIEQLVVIYKADADVADFAGRKASHYLSQDSVAGRRSSAFLRSEMLLLPKRGANSLTPKRRELLLSGPQTNKSYTAAASASPTISSLLGKARPVTTLMLPPRDLPTVVKRRPVSTSRAPSLSESHSDSETSGVPPGYLAVQPIRPSGSTSDIVSTLV